MRLSEKFILTTLSASALACGDSSDNTNNVENSDIVLEDCVKPDPNLDCLLLEGKQLRIETQEEVDLICNSSCTKAHRIFISDSSDSKKLKILRRITEVDRLSVSGDVPADLKYLSGLTRAISISIGDSNKLKSFKGLEALEYAETFMAENLPSIRNMEGLNNLKDSGQLGSVFRVSSNDSLQSLKGLENLSSVGKLEVTSNPSLKTLEGLENLEATRSWVYIEINRSLTSIEALKNLKTIKHSIRIEDNPALPQCQAEKLVTQIGGKAGLGPGDPSIRIVTGNNTKASCD